MKAIKLNQYQNIYFVGIKGAGMAGLAQLFKKMGKQVSGSDVSDPFFTDVVLERQGIEPLIFNEDNITPEIDLIIYSTAYNEINNIEFKKAKDLKIPMLSYPQALGSLFAGRYTIAVCGTHGKTTTTGMLGYVLQELGKNPMVVVGSDVQQLGGNARFGTGKYLVIEADEYQNKLQYYNPQAVILTSADWDHPDYFPGQAAYNQVFKDFIRRLPSDGILVAFTDDPNVAEIVKVAPCPVIEYGDKDLADLGLLTLQIPGEHNLWNAAAVLKMIEALGIDLANSKEILKSFKGAKRRFELLGLEKGVKVYDDYAHHPREVEKLLQAARVKFPRKKIWAVFQPHTYTRTKALLADFGKVFGPADEVIILDIFGSAREPRGTVTPQDVVAEINQHSHNAAYRGKLEQVVDYLAGEVKPGNVVLTIGAGENWKVGVGLIEKLSA